jgi:hypothetical protein
MHKFLHLNFFSTSLCVTFLSDGTDVSIRAQILYFFFLFLIIIAVLFAKTSLFVHLGSLIPLHLHVRMLTYCRYI